MSSSDHQMAEALSDFCKCNMLSSLPNLCKASTTCPDLGSNLEAGSAKRRECEDARKRKDICPYIYLFLFFWSRCQTPAAGNDKSNCHIYSCFLLLTAKVVADV